MRHVGKPRKRWVNAVEIGSRENLKVRNWRRESLDVASFKRGQGSSSGCHHTRRRGRGKEQEEKEGEEDEEEEGIRSGRIGRRRGRGRGT
jgi:hypothetical protein